MGRGTWKATVHRVTKSWTRLNTDTHTHTHTHTPMMIIAALFVIAKTGSSQSSCQ